MRAYSLLLLLLPILSFAQSTQSIRGTIVDSESLITIPGVNVILKGSDPIRGCASDMDGTFTLEQVPIGRVSLLIKALGYEDAHLDNLLLTSGKELQLEVKLNPSFEQLAAIEVTNKKENNEAVNEMATLSVRSFEVEETQRYAAAAFDPSRMALAFAGVVSANDDFSNEISVRGNSPKGVLWRLEGIEIPNPNHFSDLGASGGGISMLSSSTLSTSDFYTGAFPSEFGNATSGVFDLNLRNGNNEVREHSIMIGALGIEAATEGYFSDKSNASYLVNYRYSTLSLLSLVYQPFGDVLPIYSDISFKVNIPKTPIGSISFFGLGGANSVTIKAEPDSSLWEENDTDNDSYESTQDVGVLGMKHVIHLNDRAYLKTVAAYSINRYTDLTTEHDLADYSIERTYDITSFQDDQFAVHSSFNLKINNRNTLRSGVNFTSKKYAFRYDNRDLEETEDWTTYIDSEGKAAHYDQYTQWKHRISEKLTSNVGYHLSYLAFNKTFSAEPRASLSYKVQEGKTLSLAVGLHSKAEHISTYFLNEDVNGTSSGLTPNRGLEIPKSLHLVAGYKFQLGPNTRATAEAYYQYQYDIPIENLDTSIFSMVNASSIWELVGREQLVSKGKARNYGIDLSVQRSFRDNYYFMLNTSVYSSNYQAMNGKWFSTRFSGDYVTSFLAGKEFNLKRKGRIFGINGKLIAAGGKRSTPFDVVDNEAVEILDRAFENRVGSYFRFDFGISYKTNRERSTHTLLLDIQNVTNRQNVEGQYYDTDDMETVTNYQVGLFPFINYRIEFQGKRKRPQIN